LLLSGVSTRFAQEDSSKLFRGVEAEAGLKSEAGVKVNVLQGERTKAK